jgi:hypothetical protein
MSINIRILFGGVVSMSRTGQHKQQFVTGYTMARPGVCAGSFAATARVHTNPDIVLMNKEAAP